MVYAFTETEKFQIENNGMMVVEFKRELRSIERLSKAVIHDLMEMAKNIGYFIRVFIEKFNEMLDELSFFFVLIQENLGYSNSRRYKMVKILSKCTGIEKKSIWKMTRHIHFARSCC